MDPAGVDAVLLDWRGTLVLGLDDRQWPHDALVLPGLHPAGTEALLAVLARLSSVLDAPGVDQAVLTSAGLDPQLVAALCAVESDLSRNPFAGDVGSALSAPGRAGPALAVVSDVQVDLRPAFAAAGLESLVDGSTLSLEVGAPDPVMFTRTLHASGVGPGEALVVGDRSRADGGAVEAGIATVLPPPLRSVTDRRLHHVLRICGLCSAGRPQPDHG